MLKAAETHAQPDATTLERTACVYTSCYCEENALLLSRRLVDSGVVPAPECLYVLFVTNRLRQTPLWCQRAASDEDGLVVWDYHVFVIEAAHGRLRRARVWDLDTRLPFPCSLDDYTHAALRPVRAPYGRVYRVVPAADLWRHFASDRSHMRLPEGGWSAAPPPYPCLGPQDGVRAVTLQQYLDVREAYEGHSQEPGGPAGSGSSDEDGILGSAGGGGRSGSAGRGGGKERGEGSAPAELGRVMHEAEMLEFFGAS